METAHVPSDDAARDDFHGCCSILASRKFINEQLIADEDHLSNLPDDCLFEILYFFGHDDLDKISSVSQKINLFTEYSRSKADKSKAMQLVLDVGPVVGQFSLVADMSDNRSDNIYIGKYMMEKGQLQVHEEKDTLEKIEKKIPKRNYYLKNEMVVAIPCYVLKRMNYLLTRFEFKAVIVDSILFDNSFMKHCERMLYSQRHLNIVDPVFISTSSIQNRDRFLEWISLMRFNIISIYIRPVSHTQIRKAEFLRSYAAASNRPNLFMDRNLGVPEDTPIVRDRTLLESVAKFQYLKMESFVVDAALVMDFLKARFRHHMAGGWTITTNAMLQRHDVIASLEADLEYDFNQGASNFHVVAFVDNKRKAGEFMHISLIESVKFTYVDVKFWKDGKTYASTFCDIE